MILSWFSKNTPKEKNKITIEDERRIVNSIKEWLPRILALPGIQVIINFDQVVGYFKSDKPQKFAITTGAIIRKAHTEGHILVQFFLDQYNQIICRPDGSPYGRQLVARNLDPKLSNAFGSKYFIYIQLKDENSQSDRVEQDVFSQFGSQFGDLLRDLLRLPEVIPLIGYDDAMKYFVTDRPSDSRIKKGALLQKSHTQGYHIVQMFLDKNNDLVCDSLGRPYGRQFIAREIDEELQECFADNDVIIVQ